MAVSVLLLKSQNRFCFKRQVKSSSLDILKMSHEKMYAVPIWITNKAALVHTHGVERRRILIIWKPGAHPRLSYLISLWLPSPPSVSITHPSDRYAMTYATPFITWLYRWQPRTHCVEDMMLSPRRKNVEKYLSTLSGHWVDSSACFYVGVE